MRRGAPGHQLPHCGAARCVAALFAIHDSGSRTQGRALDHIGFEVRNLEVFLAKLAASGIKLDIAYRKVPALNIAVAFFTDPWGTYIELTEGLGRVTIATD